MKPEYRRHPNQRFTYATFTLNSTTEANRLIRDGLYICSTNTYPKRLKYKPKQCMKCWKWGHFAADCQANSDTCSTCRGEHMTRECNEGEKRYCISCRMDDHPSWDRSCPEFHRKSTHFDELHPENALTYFLTEEYWTHSTRLERIPIDSRFPTKFTVGGLLMLGYTERQRPEKMNMCSNKRGGAGKSSGTQGTLDKYVEKQV